MAGRLAGLDSGDDDLLDTEGRHQAVQGGSLVRVEGRPAGVTGGPSQDLQADRAGTATAAPLAPGLGAGAGELEATGGTRSDPEAMQ